MMSPDSDPGSPDSNGPIVVHEGALNLKSRVMFCTRWKKKYVKVRADTRQIAIYDKKVSAKSTGKRGECLVIQLKQVVECRPDVTSNKRNSFLLQKTPNAGDNQIIFGCVNPADRDQWVHVINDVMNGTVSGQLSFDDVVVSSSALTHLVKTRPKNPGRRPPGHRSRAVISSPTSEISSFGDDADSGVGASSELLATHSSGHKSDGELGDDVIEQSPTSQESAERQAASSNECLVDVQVEDSPPKSEKHSSLQRTKKQKKSPSESKTSKQESADSERQAASSNECLVDVQVEDSPPKSEKHSSLQRTKKQKKSLSESKTSKQEKNPSFFSRLGSRISRALSRSQSTEESAEQTKKTEEPSKGTDAEKEETDNERKIEEIKEEETKEEVKVSNARDTFYAMPPGTKSGHDKVIMELAAIAQNAQLVAAKAEALKSARLQSESDSSGEESSGDGKKLSRRDSEKNIEQAAENLRTTLKNLNEAELLEIEKLDSDDKADTQKEESKPDTAPKMKMDKSVINEMAGLFAKSNKPKKREASGEKAPDAETADAKSTKVGEVSEKDKASNEIVNDSGHDDGLDSTKEEEPVEKMKEEQEDEPEKEESKIDESKKDESKTGDSKKDESKPDESKPDEPSEEKEKDSKEDKNEENKIKTEEIDTNVSDESKQGEPGEDDNNDHDDHDDNVEINGNSTKDDNKSE